jgi:3-methyl-2-oxobutanoate hydroxymethyltransferase
VRRSVEVGIPVMGHVGLTPQSVHAMGGFRVQGRTEDAASRILADAQALDDAGVYAIVLEGMPAALAEQVSRAVSVPTIGIGAGPHCDGQVLVCYDFLGMYQDIRPKFVKRYAELGELITHATREYVAEVQGGAFPSAEHSFGPATSSPETGAQALVSAELPGYGPAGDDDA